MHYRYRETVYHLAVVRTLAGPAGMSVTVDGIQQHDKAIPLVDDHQEHWVEVRMDVTGGALHSPEGDCSKTQKAGAFYNPG